jgi:hypothetical protein
MFYMEGSKSAILLFYIKYIDMKINAKYWGCVDAEWRVIPKSPQEWVQFRHANRCPRPSRGAVWPATVIVGRSLAARI